jgi:hypothetical protein
MKDEDNKYIFRRIRGLSHFPLQKLLLDKYHFKPKEAEMLESFLMSMLKW